MTEIVTETLAELDRLQRRWTAAEVTGSEAAEVQRSLTMFGALVSFRVRRPDTRRFPPPVMADWLNGGTVDNDELVAEMRVWVDFLSDEPERRP